MSNIRSLDDFNKNNPQDDKKTTNYTGGEHSGLSVENAGPFGDQKQENLSSENRITVYKNGYIAGKNEFQELDEENLEKFCQEMKNGVLPKQLRDKQFTSMSIGVELKRNEIYKTEPRSTLFKGAGATLSGSTSSATSSNTTSSATVDITQNPIQVDETKPTTAIRIRFHNGKTSRQVFNQDHTLEDLFLFFLCVAPLDSNYEIGLFHGYPPQEIFPSSSSLKEAGLLQTTITQVAKTSD